jgi:ribosomal protein S27AE
MESIVYEGISFNQINYNGNNYFRRKTIYAIKKGILKRKPCEICGNENSIAHHETYSDYLNVRWLCSHHHGTVHGLLNAINGGCNEFLITKIAIIIPDNFAKEINLHVFKLKMNGKRISRAKEIVRLAMVGLEFEKEMKKIIN